MARAKIIYILVIRVNKLFSFFSSRCFLKEIENMYSVFLLRYRNTRESLGELEKAVETLAPTAFLVLPNFHLCFHNSIETRYMFLFLNYSQTSIDTLSTPQWTLAWHLTNISIDSQLRINLFPIDYTSPSTWLTTNWLLIECYQGVDGCIDDHVLIRMLIEMSIKGW